jgi:hypothetical protein
MSFLQGAEPAMSRIDTSSWRATVVLLALVCVCQINASAHDLVICKVSDPARPVLGAFDFTVTGVQGSVGSGRV